MQTAETELSTGKVTVTGTMDANKLVDYVYRSTRKQAKIVPQEEPKPEPEPEKKEQAGEAKPEEKKEEEKSGEEEGKKDEGDGSGENKSENNNKEGEGGGEQVEMMNMEDEGIKRMMMYQYYYQPLYVVERIPPPQLFSDENPNACCIS